MSYDWRACRVPSRVVGIGPRDGYAPDSVSRDAFDVGVHGTYNEYRVRLVRFQPGNPNKKLRRFATYAPLASGDEASSTLSALSL